MAEAERVARSWDAEMRKGYLKLTTLLLLSRNSLTGYGIMKEVEKRTLGLWKPTTGGIYPRLKELEEKGYIEGQWTKEEGRRKKIYSITDAGRQVLEAAFQKQQQAQRTMRSLFQEIAQDILETKLPPPPNLELGLPPFGVGIEDKPVDEQVRILKDARAQIRRQLKQIETRLEKLEEKKVS